MRRNARIVRRPARACTVKFHFIRFDQHHFGAHVGAEAGVIAEAATDIRDPIRGAQRKAGIKLVLSTIKPAAQFVIALRY